MVDLRSSCAARVLVIVPTFNERENLPVLTRRLLEGADCHLLIVDDDSPDGTGAVADALAAQYTGRISVLHRRGPRGLGHAYVAGFQVALESGAELICQMDADLSHDPVYLPDLIEAASEFDLVIGSRYVSGVSVVNWPLRRILLSKLANRYIRAVTRLRIRDCTGGFRCWRREALARLPIARARSNGYAFMVETLYEAARLDCRIGEVPIIFVERRAGASKVSRRVLRESLVMPWRLVLRQKVHGRSDRASRNEAGETSPGMRPAAMREPEEATVASAGTAPRIDYRTVLRYK